MREMAAATLKEDIESRVRGEFTKAWKHEASSLSHCSTCLVRTFSVMLVPALCNQPTKNSKGHAMQT